MKLRGVLSLWRRRRPQRPASRRPLRHSQLPRILLRIYFAAGVLLGLLVIGTIGFYLANTGIPVNFGITIVLAVLIGMVVAGQTFYLFTLENLKQYGVLKAIGVSDGRIVAMILLQACVVGLIGYGLGMGLVAAFFEVMLGYLPVRGIVVQPVAALATGVVVLAIVTLASLLSVRRVLVLEPAAVFRG